MYSAIFGLSSDVVVFNNYSGVMFYRTFSITCIGALKTLFKSTKMQKTPPKRIELGEKIVPWRLSHYPPISRDRSVIGTDHEKVEMGKIDAECFTPGF